MKTAFRLIVLVLLLAGWMLAAGALHVIRATDANSGRERWLLLPKGRLAAADTFVDVRAWSPVEVGAHPNLVRRLIESGKADALATAAPVEQRSRLVEFLQSTLANPPTTAPSTQPN